MYIQGWGIKVPDSGHTQTRAANSNQINFHFLNILCQVMPPCPLQGAAPTQAAYAHRQVPQELHSTTIYRD